jgi:hypothetical protein
MKQETSISPKIPKLLAVVVGLVPLRSRFRKGHRLGCFARDADMVKVDGVIKSVFGCDHHNGIAGDFLIGGHVDAQKETDQEQTDDNHNDDFTFFPDPHAVESSLFREW